MKAKVWKWTEAGQAEQFMDIFGGVWVYVADAMDGTIAIQSTYNAGIFVWGREEDEGEITLCQDEATYSIGNPDELIVKNGRWRSNEE